MMKNLYLATLFFFYSCNSILKTAYDDTTARYNAYFLAKEEIKSIETDYQKNEKENYDSLIDLTYKIDTNSISNINERTENSIKKLSILIQRQINSKYVYPSYALIGKSRLLNLDLKESITTLKYVNSKSNNEQANLMALVYLQRAYTENEDYNSALQVNKYLENKNMNNDLRVEHYKNSFQLFKNINDEIKILSTLKNLQKLKLKKKFLNKVNFALGQTYYYKDSLNLSKEYFQKSIKNNSDINMGFYARIYIAKSFDLSDEEKAIKSFKKLLKDKKNLEYQDRIYYEMARYYLKNNKYDESIKNFQKAIRLNISNKEVLFNSHLEIANIFYEKKNNYIIAQKYYDSAVTNINRENEYFDKIKKRSDVLNNLIKNLDVISKNDSLLDLIKLPEEEIKKIINIKIAKENKKREKQKRIINQSYNMSEEPMIIKIKTDEGVWYFDNPILISNGIREFEIKWGKRDLVDNWRFISKVVFKISEETNEEEDLEDLKEEENEKSDGVDKLYSKLPFTEENKEKLYVEIEEALAEVGKIYIQKLNEIDKGIKSHLKFIERFPNSLKLADIYYQLFLIAENKNDYKNIILNKFPNSIFSKLIINPNYEIDEFKEYNYLLNIYKDLYQSLTNDKNEVVISKVDSLSNIYQKSIVFQNILLLKSIAIGKKEGNFSLQYELKNFLNKATEKSAIEFAKSLLKSAEKVHKEFVYSGLPKFKKNITKRFFLAIINDLEDSAYLNQLDGILLDIDKKYYRDTYFLKDGIVFDIIGSDDNNLIENINKKFKEVNLIEDKEVNANFVISEKNLNLIFKSKNFEEFEKFYINESN
tara:strand:+ start:8879 stop:11338 length:2460 start_codon:yes stop_codon:yes gene_type:complete